ncbi:hypothetical protein EAS64_23125 [Trebonia kvetii]|uniref:Uncharacterized protein n=1 Tax=Trebonia kvetii TaxID=2480626 RepID=A0A6P2BW04_9ACTN|nr:hypothetical protein [Trebonia kvetii]TVZ03309.1 hypothetical protein EAS64_23125 [Trebonia kvetii]
MPGIASLEAFQRGVHEFDIDTFQLDIEPAALEAARRSLDESGLLLLGEVHGVRQNSLIARELMTSLDITGLALEWPAGLASAISGFFEDGQVPDHPLLWGGDGRITAGHFAMLWERFSAGRLLALTLFDGVNEVGWSRREAAMAERILTAQGPAARTLVIAGSAHTALAPTGLGIPLGARLREQRSGVREVQIKYGNGGYYNLSPQRFKRQWSLHRRARLRLEGAGLVLDLPSPVQARVPHRVLPNQRPLRPAAAGFTGAFPAYHDAQPLTGPQRQLGPLRQGQPTGPFPAHGSPYQREPQQAQQRQTGSSPALPYPDQAYADRGYPGQPHGAPNHQPGPGYPAEPGQPPFMGHPQQSQPDPAGYQRHRRVLPYEVELPTR